MSLTSKAEKSAGAFMAVSSTQPATAVGGRPLLASEPPSTEPAMVLIESRPWWRLFDLIDVWRCRELLFILARRDIQVRYRQTILGVAWAVIQPLGTVLAFWGFFGKLAGVPSDGIPYPVFVGCGVLPWQLFSFALNHSANSLVAEQQIIRKSYFPRLIVPLAAVISGVLDFAVGFLLLLLLMLCRGMVPAWSILLVPLLVMLTLTAALAVGLWLSALNAKYRDVRYLLPFLTQIWLLATPVAYPSSLMPKPWRTLFALNPMAGIVDGFRMAMLGSGADVGRMLTVSSLTVLVVLAGGLAYFRHVESTLADVL